MCTTDPRIFQAIQYGTFPNRRQITPPKLPVFADASFLIFPETSELCYEVCVGAKLFQNFIAPLHFICRLVRDAERSVIIQGVPKLACNILQRILQLEIKPIYKIQSPEQVIMPSKIRLRICTY